MKVYNMTSSQGNKIANQFEIYHNNNKYFQSYNSIIIKQTNKKTYLDSYYYNYSRTTSKYRNIFLNEDTKTILKKIKNKEYILTNLN